MGVRRTAREYALMILYKMDVAGSFAGGAVLPDLAIDRVFNAFADGEPLDPPPPFLDAPPPEEPVAAEAKEYAGVLVRGVFKNREAIDTAIQTASSHWRLDRMARVDRNILRLGSFELLFLSEDVPRKVVINEAVEIAKRYSTRESGAFINGLLDRVEPPKSA